MISGLVKRRATLSGEITKTQEQLKKMLTNLDILDAAIRMFDADYPINGIKPKSPRPQSDWENRGEMIRLIFSILRQAAEPLSARDIALQLMTHKQMDASCTKAVILMRRRVGCALRKKRRSGHLRSHQKTGYPILWEVVP